MNRSSSLFVAAVCGGVAIFTGLLLVRPAPAGARSTSDAGLLESCTIRGRLTVELALDPQGGAAAAAWASPIKDVNEITILDKWVLLSKRDGLKSGTLVVPREKIVFINIVD